MARVAFAGLAVAFLRAAAVSAQRCSEPDSAALAQREVHVSRPPAMFWRRSRVGDVGAEVGTHSGADNVQASLRVLVGRLQAGLQEHEHNLQLESSRALLIKTYLEKVERSLFKKGTFLSDLGGLVPLGHMDEADQAVASALLDLFRGEAFAAVVADSISNVTDGMMHYRWRAEKRVASLLAASANATDARLSSMLVSFFQNQQHLIGDFLGALRKSVRAVVAELPKSHVIAEFASLWSEQLMTKAIDFLDASIKAITKSHGDVFCQRGQQFVMQDLLPIVNSTVASLQTVVGLAKAQAPDVAEHLTPVAEALTGVLEEVGLLEKLAPAWTERVCGLVGARAQ